MMTTSMASAAGKAVPNAAPVPGAASASGTGAGFGQMLVQVIGGTANGNTASGSLPDLGQLLAGLLGNLSPEEASGLLESDGLKELGELLTQVTEKPELLDQLLGTEEMQEWLMQAAMLLQGMQVLPEEVNLDSSVEAINGTGASVLSREQAQLILKAFTQASFEQPGNVFLEQLQEKLKQITAKRPEKAAGNDGGTISAASGKSESSGDTGAMIQISSTSSNASRLEMLAAKTMPLNRLQLLLSSQEQPASEGVETGKAADGTGVTTVIPQDVNRLIPHNAALPTEAAVKADSLVEDMSQFLLGKLRIHTGNGLTEARLSLTPESLGHVEVKLSLQNGQLVAHFAAQTAMGKDLLESQLPQLRMVLASQGIQVEKMEVTQSPTLQSGMFQEQRHQQQSQNFGNQNGNNRSKDGSEEYAVEAAALLSTSKELEQEGFDVTA